MHVQARCSRTSTSRVRCGLSASMFHVLPYGETTHGACGTWHESSVGGTVEREVARTDGGRRHDRVRERWHDRDRGRAARSTTCSARHSSPCRGGSRSTSASGGPTELSPFDAGFLVGVLVGEGHFGGDGRQPQVTLRMHSDHAALFAWLMERFPESRLYGPYDHAGRRYYQWMARSAFLRERLHADPRAVPSTRALGARLAAVPGRCAIATACGVPVGCVRSIAKRRGGAIAVGRGRPIGRGRASMTLAAILAGGAERAAGRAAQPVRPGTQGGTAT